MHRILAFSLLSLLAGCGDAKETKIADIDFSDPASVRRVKQALTYNDQIFFDHYVKNRTRGVAVTRADRTSPATVAEAIELTRAGEIKSNALSKLRDPLMDQRNALVEDQNKLISEANALVGMEGRISNPTRYDQLQQFAAADKERIADLDAALERTKGQKH